MTEAKSNLCNSYIKLDIEETPDHNGSTAKSLPENHQQLRRYGIEDGI